MSKPSSKLEEEAVKRFDSACHKACEDGNTLMTGVTYTELERVFSSELSLAYQSGVEETVGEVEKVFDQFRSSSKKDKKGKRIFGVASFQINSRSLYNGLLEEISHLSNITEKV